MKTLGYYPTVSWGNRRNERWSSKIHYLGDDNRTLCGKRIKTCRANDSWDMCEKCVQIVEARLKAEQ